MTNAFINRGINENLFARPLFEFTIHDSQLVYGTGRFMFYSLITTLNYNSLVYKKL